MFNIHITGPLLIPQEIKTKTAVSRYFGEDTETAEWEVGFEPASFLFYQKRWISVKSDIRARAVQQAGRRLVVSCTELREPGMNQENTERDDKKVLFSCARNILNYDRAT